MLKVKLNIKDYRKQKYNNALSRCLLGWLSQSYKAYTYSTQNISGFTENKKKPCLCNVDFYIPT